MLNEVGAPDAERFQFVAAYPSFDPLMHSLAGNRRIDVLTGLFNAVIVARSAVARALFLA